MIFVVVAQLNLKRMVLKLINFSKLFIINREAESDIRFKFVKFKEADFSFRCACFAHCSIIR